jgi:hypothetical protein
MYGSYVCDWKEDSIKMYMMILKHDGDDPMSHDWPDGSRDDVGIGTNDGHGRGTVAG